jgi:hypothetical protein
LRSEAFSRFGPDAERDHPAIGLPKPPSPMSSQRMPLDLAAILATKSDFVDSAAPIA